MNKEQSVQKFLKFLVMFLVVISLISCNKQGSNKFELSDNWQFKQTDSSKWLLADVPGCSHLDLLAHGLIGDPFFGDNENELQWIGETDWEYKTSFEGGDLITWENIELVFEGLDTYTDIYLNDSLILSADNMFIKWEIDIRDLIKKERNDLYIRFFSPFRIEKDKEAEVSYKLPEIRGFTRKAPYQYGWDWGPTFVTSGIWKPAYIRTWNSCRIENIHIVQQSITESKATVQAIVEIISSEEIEAEISVEIKETGIDLAEKEFALQPGINKVKLDFEIENPELWWPNGLGKQPLYDLEFELETSKVVDNRIERIGIREIELIRTPDSIGESFYFKVNGHPVFMKGANYIPQDNFPSRVADEKYRQTIQTAVDANMNMLRVWGGGIYEKDIFYDLCDENGILVWQDFMFACNMYPGDSAFLHNVKQEAIQNVKRLRNHPSIALWCGNNEVSEGWFNWGWQKSLGYSEQDSLNVWQAYLDIFESILPNVISGYDSERAYWPSSPSIGWGHKEAMYSGDMHYWGVWWGEEPFEIYEEKVGRFMSEYGFQGFPDLKTLDSCLSENDFHFRSENLLNHQKHPRGMELIQTYMEREYTVPDNFEDYAYVSQLVQAYGIRKALEAHRRAMPYCMGTLYWQLNDCWPVISWSSVDYYNRWKALHYFTKKAYDDLLISFERNNDSLAVFVISDYLQKTRASLQIEVLDFDGNKVYGSSDEISIPAASSGVYSTLDISNIPTFDHLILARLMQKDSVVASNLFYFLPPKDLMLPDVVITKEVTQTEKGYFIKISSDKLAKNVFLSVDLNGFFSDNYFDLLPGQIKGITFTTDTYIDSFENKLKIISLVN